MPPERPAIRVMRRLAALPDAAAIALDTALERAEARARVAGRPVALAVEFEVSERGIEALELRTRYDWTRGT